MDTEERRASEMRLVVPSLPTGPRAPLCTQPADRVIGRRRRKRRRRRRRRRVS